MRIFILRKINVIRVALCIVLIIGIIAAVGILTPGDVTTFSDGSTAMVTNADRSDRAVALTIDTAFGEDHTGELLELLKTKNVTATFAVMGEWAMQNKNLVGEIIDGGHQVISHTYAHKRYSEMSPEENVEDAKTAKNMLSAEFGVDTGYIRPAYGDADEKTLSALKSAGFTPVKWSVDMEDWRKDGAQKAEERVLADVSGGDIILMQNNSPDGCEALQACIDKMKELGYQFVSLEDLLSESETTRSE